jgi:hypothetical protein
MKQEYERRFINLEFGVYGNEMRILVGILSGFK